MPRFSFRNMDIGTVTGDWVWVPGSPGYYQMTGFAKTGTIQFRIFPGVTLLDLDSGTWDGGNPPIGVITSPDIGTFAADAPPAGFTPTDFIWVFASQTRTGPGGNIGNPLVYNGNTSGSLALVFLPDGSSYFDIAVGVSGTLDLSTDGGVSQDIRYYPSLSTINGNYTTSGSSVWYYNPATNHYQYAAAYPGSPWEEADPDPVPDVVSVRRETEYDDGVALGVLGTGQGCAATPITITGTGFGDGATVTVGGVAATSVVVVNSTSITAVTPAHADGLVNVVVTNADLTTDTLVGGFTYLTPWWVQTLTIVIDGHDTNFYFYAHQCAAPTDGLWTIYSPSTPAYVANPNGWYFSTEGYAGSVGAIAGATPGDPRLWGDISVWAASETAMLGGSPAASCTFENRLIYPATGYTVGTHYPPIRVFNGSFDHELCRLPPTTSDGVPQAVLSMLAADGTIFLTSFDSGTTSADWRGRVFSLDLESAKLTPLGTQFAAGEMPYALCWHMGRLWCGTNNGIGTIGKIYSFRPGIDTAWTLDYATSSSSAGGVNALASFNGKLYVGTDNAAASRGKVLVRDSAGAYTTSDTGSGGTARVNNGFLSLKVFEGALYASYWNNDTTAIAFIRKFDGSSWTTAYTGAAGTLRPFGVLFEDAGTLFAFGCGFHLTGVVLTSPDGTTWTNQTANLPESTRILLPILGVEIL